jgi:hypothetical protein
MSKRRWKIAALVLSGGVLLQLGGCVSLLAEQVLGTIVGQILSMFVQNIINAAANTT